MFFHGADWFLNNQDSSGGWPSQVVFNKDRKKYPMAGELRPGWYGAMCQGQAISVLVRAAQLSGDTKYLQAALQAVKVFSVPSDQGGVKRECGTVIHYYLRQDLAQVKKVQVPVRYLFFMVAEL